MIKAGFWKSANYQDYLLALLTRDAKACIECGRWLTGKDFEPIPNVPDGRERFITGTVVLEFFQQYRKPIKDLLESQLRAYMESLNLTPRVQHSTLSYAKRIQSLKVPHPKAIIDRIVEYKVERHRTRLLRQLADLHGAGRLTDKDWEQAFRDGLRRPSKPKPLDFFSDESVATRIRRRSQTRFRSAPCFLIDPLDQLVQGIRSGQIGLVIAPTKRGKSLFLIWVSAAYVVQGLNVLHFTLEDPKPDVEDRFDSAITGIPIHELSDSSKFQRRWKLRKRLYRSQLKVIDGTDQSLSVADIESEYLAQREEGFFADALVIDYDDEVAPARRLNKRNEELDQIYRDLRRLASKYDLIVWTAAQTQRGTEDLKILQGSRVADAIGKVRKCTMALGLGKSDWDVEDSIYIWVAAHKFDRMNCGCDIVGDKSRMVIYDPVATEREARNNSGSSTPDLDGMEF